MAHAEIGERKAARTQDGLDHVHGQFHLLAYVAHPQASCPPGAMLAVPEMNSRRPVLVEVSSARLNELP